MISSTRQLPICTFLSLSTRHFRVCPRHVEPNSSQAGHDRADFLVRVSRDHTTQDSNYLTRADRCSGWRFVRLRVERRDTSASDVQVLARILPPANRTSSDCHLAWPAGVKMKWQKECQKGPRLNSRLLVSTAKGETSEHLEKGAKGAS